MGLALGLELFLHLLNAALQLLDALLHLGNQGLLVVQLGGQLGDVSLLAADGVLDLPLDALQVGHGLLGHLEFALNLPLLLVKSTLQLIKGVLELGLDGVQVGHLLIGRDQVIVGLGLGLSNVLLLLVELVDDFILLGDFVIQGLDGVVPVGLLLLNLGDGKLDVFNVLLDIADGTSMLLDLGSQLNSGSLLGGQVLLLGGQLNLGLSLHLGSLGLSVSVDGQVALLLLQLGGQRLDVILEGIHLSLQGGSNIKSLLVLAVGFIGLLLQKPKLLLGVGHANKRTSLLDDDEPSPISHGHVLSELPLADHNKFSLSTLLLIDNIPQPLVDLTLQVPDKLHDDLITSLLKLGQSASLEEDQSVTKTVAVSVEGNLVHKSIDSSLVILRAVDLSSAKDGITHLVVRVEHPVGEASHTDSDTLKHTIASQLVHDKRRLDITGLLVGVGHKATHKVGLASIQGGHELTQRHQLDGGDSLAAATLLLLLALFLGGGGGLARVVSPQMLQQLAGGSALEDLNNSVVDRVLVLLKPVGDIVRHNTGVVRDGKVGVLVSLGLGLQEDRELAMGSLQLLLKGLVSSLGEERLLLKNGPDTHGLLKHDDGSSQVHTEVNHDPVNTFLDIFLLLNNEHVMVEELLKLLVDKVNGDLLKTVVLENLETSNIQDSAEVGLLEGSIN